MKKKTNLLIWNIIVLGVLVSAFFSPLRNHVYGIFLDAPSNKGLEKNKKIGAEVYKIALQNMKGKTVFIPKNGKKKIFLNLWATWCGPCLAEFPSIQSSYEKHQNSTDFYLISLDDNEEKVRQFVQDNKYTVPVYFPLEVLPKSIKPSTIPHSYILDSSGVILLSHSGAAQWDDASLHKYFH